MRFSNSDAGSSFGSCGRSPPRNALARMAWSSLGRRWSARACSVATLSSHVNAISIRRIISTCSARVGRSNAKLLSVARFILGRVALCTASFKLHKSFDRLSGMPAIGGHTVPVLSVRHERPTMFFFRPSLMKKSGSACCQAHQRRQQSTKRTVFVCLKSSYLAKVMNVSFSATKCRWPMFSSRTTRTPLST